MMDLNTFSARLGDSPSARPPIDEPPPKNGKKNPQNPRNTPPPPPTHPSPRLLLICCGLMPSDYPRRFQLQPHPLIRSHRPLTSTRPHNSRKTLSNLRRNPDATPSNRSGGIPAGVGPAAASLLLTGPASPLPVQPQLDKRVKA